MSSSQNLPNVFNINSFWNRYIFTRVLVYSDSIHCNSHRDRELKWQSLEQTSRKTVAMRLQKMAHKSKSVVYTVNVCRGVKNKEFNWPNIWFGRLFKVIIQGLRHSSRSTPLIYVYHWLLQHSSRCPLHLWLGSRNYSYICKCVECRHLNPVEDFTSKDFMHESVLTNGVFSMLDPP